MTTAKDVRTRLVRALRRDLIGPGPLDHDLAGETLDAPPSRWYLTGFLAPVDEAEKIESVAEPDTFEDMEGGDEAGDLDEGTEPASTDGQGDGAAAKRKFIPSSLGLSFLLEPEVCEIEVEVTWGDYVPEPPLEEGLFAREPAPEAEGDDLAKVAQTLHWRRLARTETLTVPIPRNGRGAPVTIENSASPVRRGGGLQLVVHAKPTPLPSPERERAVTSVALFLVNHRSATNRYLKDATYVFQAGLKVRSASPIVARADLSGYRSADVDMRIADLHFAQSCEFAVGRNCSADWSHDAEGQVHTIRTEPLPEAEVERVAPNLEIGGVEFAMQALAEATGDASALAAALERLPAAYEAWIATQRPERFGIRAPRRLETADILHSGMTRAKERIASGIARLVSDATARKAFGLMNRAMAQAGRRRMAIERGVTPDDIDPPIWRPFQLAFILLNLDGLAQPDHADREIVDLLFFPTGGGKTEAYLGLAAFDIAYRRVTSTGMLGAGVTVIMRYTLRLLTLDQLGRAAGMVCALERLREDPENGLGAWPIEIGLWVGSAASPNRLNDKSDRSAASRVRRYRRDGKIAPAPLKSCPWCGTAFDRDSFRLWPKETAPTRLLLKCVNPVCDFTGDRHLPVLVTDEEIYRRLPAFMIATVDKFAALPWEGEVGSFFGHVDRADAGGFYGAATPGGARLELPLQPPSLIIQDELHLITGPLGTVAGLYECAIDRLASREVAAGQWVRPKIVASTATARRASTQISDLFDRKETEIFPPPGLDRKDSFFAKTVPSSEDPARLYVGVAAIGKGQKLVFLRALRTLMATARQAYEEGGEVADPYLTAVCYFNALRELGSARRIVEDEVRNHLRDYGRRRVRVDPATPDFADREIGDPLELTSRVSTDKVAEAKERLQMPFPKSAAANAGDICDVAMATNMISVGLDITRLGLMVVNGQPKTASEYIQATSRVGRDHARPGLVVTLLNPHKPRDRAHYESFRHFHEAFYRAVEGASVTPWAPRALDRALPAVTVSLARHLDPALSREGGAGALNEHPAVRAMVIDEIVRRAGAKAPQGGSTALDEQVAELLDAWSRIETDAEENGALLGYTTRAGANRRLLREVLDPSLSGLNADEKRFKAPRSMRGVESSVLLRIRGPNNEWIN